MLGGETEIVRVHTIVLGQVSPSLGILRNHMLGPQKLLWAAGGERGSEESLCYHRHTILVTLLRKRLDGVCILLCFVDLKEHTDLISH